MTSQNFETPKRELLVFYYKYQRRLALAFLAPFLLAVAISFVPTPRYEASSSMIVRLGSEYVYQPTAGGGTGGQPSPIPFERDQIYKAEVAILSSSDLHEQVMKEIGLDRLYPVRQDGHFSALRAGIVGVLDRWFPDDADESMLGQAASSLRIALQDPTDDPAAAPEDKERKRLEKADEVFDKNLKINLEKESAVITLTFQHKDRDTAVATLDSLLKLYLEKRKQLYMETHATQVKQQADGIRRRVVALQGQIEAYKREHKIYSLADQRFQLLQQREEARKQMMTVSSHALDDKLNNVTAQLDALDAQERQYNALEHDLQTANDEYTIYAHKLDEAQAQDSMERSSAGSVRVVEQPHAPPEPKRLQMIIILAGFMLSLIFTVIVAAITEFSRSGFLTPERLERSIGLPILCAVPLRKK